MLFTDPYFIFVFLPVVLAFYFGARKYIGGNVGILILALASMGFYGYWSFKYLFLLLGQIAFNYLLARWMIKDPRRVFLWIGVTVNLLLLGYFKYRNFFLENVEILSGMHFHLSALFVPLGISFHTFQQITYLTDVADGEEDEVPPFPQYLLFVLFFPQLVAGPIVLHREMGRQLTDASQGKFPQFNTFGPGFVLFCLGLFKKVCLADNISPFVDLAFSGDGHLKFYEAWAAAVAYTVQLYFDFSGYSDMAVGLGLMFGFRLPHNFNIPFAARSMIEYWKRWHITMTRFFTMYIYSPLALAAHRYTSDNGFGRFSTFLLTLAIPTLITFLASGLWHGAGWTFVVFGLVNAVGLLVNHAWRELKMPRLPLPLAWFLTMCTVLVAEVYFRAASIDQANAMLRAMYTPSSFALPLWASAVASRIGLGIEPFEIFQAVNFTAQYGSLLLLLVPLSILMPNPVAEPFGIKPNLKTAFVVALMLWPTMGWLGQPRTFLYFQF